MSDFLIILALFALFATGCVNYWQAQNHQRLIEYEEYLETRAEIIAQMEYLLDEKYLRDKAAK